MVNHVRAIIETRSPKMPKCFRHDDGISGITTETNTVSLHHSAYGIYFQDCDYANKKISNLPNNFCFNEFSV